MSSSSRDKSSTSSATADNASIVSSSTTNSTTRLIDQSKTPQRQAPQPSGQQSAASNYRHPQTRHREAIVSWLSMK
ncbi:hypothetical protein EV356DRAFT_503439 [Viridothelium virens]|uniref:Uncharacterized protein n=1 Tax=Viridothelium virens TaxID=1048519 RepID=A0A6A6H6Q0_VIRVR|nr:hypothetical protein EV356DRAFT_503439 [Viridothelium virens]